MGGITVQPAPYTTDLPPSQVHDTVFKALELSRGQPIQFMAGGRIYTATAHKNASGEITGALIQSADGQTVYSSQGTGIRAETVLRDTNIAKQLWNQAVREHGGRR